MSGWIALALAVVAFALALSGCWEATDDQIEQLRDTAEQTCENGVESMNFKEGTFTCEKPLPLP